MPFTEEEAQRIANASVILYVANAQFLVFLAIFWA
jgi:hypothetical protein